MGPKKSKKRNKILLDQKKKLGKLNQKLQIKKNIWKAMSKK